MAPTGALQEPNFTHLTQVRPGDEITFPYSPNFQYSAAIDYARLPESST